MIFELTSVLVSRNSLKYTSNIKIGEKNLRCWIRSCSVKWSPLKRSTTLLCSHLHHSETQLFALSCKSPTSTLTYVYAVLLLIRCKCNCNQHTLSPYSQSTPNSHSLFLFHSLHSHTRSRSHINIKQLGLTHRAAAFHTLYLDRNKALERKAHTHTKQTLSLFLSLGRQRNIWRRGQKDDID